MALPFEHYRILNGMAGSTRPKTQELKYWWTIFLRVTEEFDADFDLWPPTGEQVVEFIYYVGSIGEPFHLAGMGMDWRGRELLNALAKMIRHILHFKDPDFEWTKRNEAQLKHFLNLLVLEGKVPANVPSIVRG